MTTDTTPLTDAERAELEALRQEDRLCEAANHAPAAAKLRRMMELEARERAGAAQPDRVVGARPSVTLAQIIDELEYPTAEWDEIAPWAVRHLKRLANPNAQPLSESPGGERTAAVRPDTLMLEADLYEGEAGKYNVRAAYEYEGGHFTLYFPPRSQVPLGKVRIVVERIGSLARDPASSTPPGPAPALSTEERAAVEGIRRRQARDEKRVAIGRAPDSILDTIADGIYLLMLLDRLAPTESKGGDRGQ